MQTNISKDFSPMLDKIQSINQSRYKTFFANHSSSTPDRFQTCNSFNQTIQFSKFNLIKWNTKIYQPSEGEKRLKIQNAMYRNRLSIEKIRPRQKAIKTEPSLVYKKSYKEDYEQIKSELDQIKVQLISKENNIIRQSFAPKAEFKLNHKSLYAHFLKKNSQCMSDKQIPCQQSSSIMSKSLLLDKKGRFNSSSTKRCLYMKSRIHSVNQRMEKVLTKWRPPTKSINERYNEIWSNYKNKNNKLNQSLVLYNRPSKLLNQSNENSKQGLNTILL